MKHYFFTLLLCVFSFISYGQESFSLADSTFFSSQESNVMSWFNSVGIDSAYFTRSRIQTVPQYVVLRLTARTADTWLNLRAAYASKNKRSIEQDLFDKFVFWCEVNPSQVQIVVNSESYEMKAGLDPDKNYTFSIEENKTKALRTETITLTREFRMETFALPANKFTTAQTDIFETARNRIVENLKNYFADKGTLFSDSKLTIKDNTDNKIVMDITNIKSEMIDDNLFKELGYFEMIMLTFKLFKKNDKIDFQCIINGKYGTGIIRQPRRNQYKDMGINGYQDYIDDYALKIKNLLLNKLK